MVPNPAQEERVARPRSELLYTRDTGFDPNFVPHLRIHTARARNEKQPGEC